MPTERRAIFDVSWRAIAKVLAAAALVWAWLQLWQFVMAILAAIVIAIALDPLVRHLEARRVPRWAGAFGAVLLLTAVLVAMVAASWMSLTEQSRFIVQNISTFYHQLLESYPVIHRLAPSGSEGFGQYVLSVGRSMSNAVALFFVALVLTAYLLIEWKSTVEWLVAFVPEQHRAKVRRTFAEARESIFHYVVGNVITSAITAFATFVALAALGVPAALMLAVIAGVFDFIPVVGFLASLAITALLAATVSPAVLIGVVMFYFAFNAFENYFLMPKVYGRELELSNLAVLVAIAVGAQLGGVMGALLALPIAGTYPAIERIWLRNRLGSDTVEIHKRLSA